MATHIDSKMYLIGDRIFGMNDIISKAYFIAQGSCILRHKDGFEENVPTAAIVCEDMLFSPGGKQHYTAFGSDCREKQICYL